MLRVFVASFVAATFFVGALHEAQGNWPGWRGPESNGSATGKPPIVWDSQTNVKWKTPILGKGSATPIVWEDQVYLLTAIETDRRNENAEVAVVVEEPQPENERGRRGGRRGFGRRGSRPSNYYQFVVVCVERQSGDIIWQQVASEAVPHESVHNTNSYASGSPVTDGKYLYASFGSYGIYCYDLDGNLQWSNDIGDMQTRFSFGEGASPSLADGTLIVNWDHEGPSFIVALDAATGEEQWREPRDEPTTWTTPLVVETDGRKQVVVNGTNRVRSYDLETGALLWECGGQVTSPIPSPVTLDDIVICMSGFRGSAAYAIPLSARGDITDSEEIVWNRNEGTPYVPSPLLYDGTLYFTKGNNGILSSLDARSGEPIIDQNRIPGISSIYASPVGAAGHVYITGRDGTTVVIRHSDDFDVVATNQLGEPVDASPAVVGDEIFLRSDKHLYCISE